MSDADFEAYLSLLSRFLRLDTRQREEIRRELRAHLEEAVEEEMAAGATRDEAVVRVLDDFGDAAELAARFSSVGRKRRWIMRGTMAAACVGLAVLVLNALSPQSAPLAVASLQADSGVGVEADAAQTDKVAPPADADSAIEAALARRMGEVSFSEAPLEAFVDHLREILEINIHVHWRDLEANGISPDAPVTIELREATGERALRLALETVGGDVDLGYEIDDGVLIIASRDRLRRWLTTEVYDVRDLLAATTREVTRLSAQRSALLRNQITTARAALERASEIMSSEERSLEAAQKFVESCFPQESAETAEELLTELVTRTVQPDSWADNGGAGTLTVFNGVLVAHQTQDVHRRLERLLSDLREAGAASAD